MTRVATPSSADDPWEHTKPLWSGDRPRGQAWSALQLGRRFYARGAVAWCEWVWACGHPRDSGP